MKTHPLEKILVNKNHQLSENKEQQNEKKSIKNDKNNNLIPLSEESEKSLNFILEECEKNKARGEKACDVALWLSNKQAFEIVKILQKNKIDFSKKIIFSSKKSEINKFQFIIIFPNN